MAGKTTIGQILSQKIEFIFDDLDDIIAARYNQNINTIFKTEGEQKFRMYEKECFNDYLNKDRHILSVGGGAINHETFNISLS